MPWIDSLIQVYGYQLGALIFGGGLAWQFWPAITKGFGKLASGGGGFSLGGDVLTENQKDFAALERLQARFEKTGCTEGKEAIKVCLQHFFHADGVH